jgi:hypothetical protein
MRNTKTMLALAFGAVMAIGLVGCSKPAEEAVAPAAPATVEAPAETMPAEPMTPAAAATAMPAEATTMPSAATMAEPAAASTAAMPTE